MSPPSCIFATPEQHQKLDNATTGKHLIHNHLANFYLDTETLAPEREGECTLAPSTALVLAPFRVPDYPPSDTNTCHLTPPD